MNRESTGLLWGIIVLALSVAIVGNLYLWKSKPQTPPPVFVNVGEVKANVGGKRLVIATVSLELSGKKHANRVNEHLPQARLSIANTISDFPEKQLGTHDGMKDLQQRIRDDLNELIGKRAVRNVLFTGFLLSIS